MDLAPVTLAGRHVSLEPLSPSHVDALWEAGRDPEVWRFTVARVTSRAEMEAYVAEALAARDQGTALPFVTVARGGAVVGTTRFGNASVRDRRVEIGWTFVAPRWQRTAVNTEAKLLMLRHAFDAWGCVRVELKTGSANVRSRAAIRRLGAVEEGVLRRHTRLPDGTWRDTVYYSILDREWPEVRARLEARLARGG